MFNVRAQFEFYFSEQNLERDIYLRSLMDPEGYVSVREIMSFRRIQTLLMVVLDDSKLNIVTEAIRSSPVLVLKDTGHPKGPQVARKVF